MNKKFKKIVLFLLSVTFMLSMIQVPVQAEETPEYSFLPPFDTWDHVYPRNIYEDEIVKIGPDYISLIVDFVNDREVSTGNSGDIDIVVEYSTDKVNWKVGSKPVKNVQGEKQQVKVTGLKKSTNYYLREVFYFRDAPEVKLVSDTPFKVKTTKTLNPQIKSIKAMKAKVKWIKKKVVPGYWASDGTWMKSVTYPAHWETSWTYKITLKEAIDADYIWVYDTKVSSNRFKYNGKKTFYVTVGHNGKLIGKKYNVYIRGEYKGTKSKKSNTIKKVKVKK
ncbi:MAG: hypothetical protein Q4D51_07730 [Eubacteriales bacterium]|nr:hypothetical protein [Eubacteriales bacterium]